MSLQSTKSSQDSSYSKSIQYLRTDGFKCRKSFALNKKWKHAKSRAIKAAAFTFLDSILVVTTLFYNQNPLYVCLPFCQCLQNSNFYYYYSQSIRLQRPKAMGVVDSPLQLVVNLLRIYEKLYCKESYRFRGQHFLRYTHTHTHTHRKTHTFL